MTEMTELSEREFKTTTTNRLTVLKKKLTTYKKQTDKAVSAKRGMLCHGIA